MEQELDYIKKPLKVVMLGPALEQMGGMATVENLILTHMPSEVELIHISTHDYGSAAFRIRHYLRALGQTLHVLAHQDVDVVHILLSQRGSALRKAILTLVAKAFGKPVILHAQSSQFHIFYDALPSVAQAALRWVFQKCTYFIALGYSWKKYYQDSLGLDQAVVLRNPVQLPAQVPDRSQHETISFLFLGRIGQRKGAFDLIQAYAELPASLKAQSRLLLAGDGEVEKARNLVHQLGVANHVTILDWLNPAQRDAYLAQVDVFVLPTHNEGLPLALLEAMGWGLAAITTPVGGIPELVNDGEDGLLITPGNVRQLSEAMETLITDRALRLTLGKKARFRVEPLNIHAYCASLIELYRSAMQQPVGSTGAPEIRHAAFDP